ncbi:S8 family serine peptidase [Streptomyces sp. NRRL B-24572]|uniref:S8 family serine peptidase n=1 Tax=Streptomyces sp. NRRL B-24572 TaxID=1962156 RepID=UPI000A3B636D|nr:S8 family serine peptidase [Streptomyces sp. NRRL B-24572]
MYLPPVRRTIASSTAGLALALAVALPAAPVLADTPPPAGQPGPAPSGRPTTHEVTLITGDTVTVTEGPDATSTTEVRRPEGAVGGYATLTMNGDTYVIPDEAYPYVANGALDKRLFDITDLIADGHDDAEAIPLIVGYGDAAVRSRSTAVPRSAETVRQLPSIHGTAIRTDRSRATGFWRELTTGAGSRTSDAESPAFAGGIAKVWLDGKVTAELADSTAQIGAPAAWAGGADGTGVTVAVLDTGYDDTHPDLAGQVDRSRSFVPGESIQDHNGHGTHVASTVAGTGAASPDRKEKGVAPGARLAIGKVLGDAGSGDMSWIIAGMEWAAKDVKAPIISMSLGSSEPSDGTDPLSEAVDTLSRETGALFVVAAGNASTAGSIGGPGAASDALTVAAVDSRDRLASFSSKGPLTGSNALKPDLSAPGVNILAARSAYIAGGSGPYQSLSGTSMATPHVAGAAAMLAQRHPDWTGSTIKSALMSSSKMLAGASAYHYGAGRLDTNEATSTTVTATGSLDFGFLAWPHDAEKPMSRTITYTNHGDQAITLTLTPDFGTWNPAFTLSQDTVTVPAHGTSPVTLTADPTKITTGGVSVSVGGQVRAAEATGTVVAHTAAALTVEAERYAMNLTVLDRRGQPVPGAKVAAQQFTSATTTLYVTDGNGRLRLRLAPGTLSLSASFTTVGDAPDSQGTALLIDPEVQLTEDTDIVLDGRKTVRADTVTERRSEPLLRVLEYNRRGGVSALNSRYAVPVANDSMWVTPTERVATGSFGYLTRARAAEPMLRLEVAGHPLDDVMVERNTPLPEGRFLTDAPLVFAGEGRADEYAGIDAVGAVAVVRASSTVPPAEQVRAAHQAGALMLVVVAQSRGRLWTDYGVDGAAAPIAVAGLRQTEGEALVQRLQSQPTRSVRMTATGRKHPTYLYDLADPHLGQIPDDLIYRATTANTTERTVRFYGTTEHTSEGRAVLPPWRTSDSPFTQWDTTPGSTRTDYVSADPELAWAQLVYRWDAAGNQIGEQRGHLRVHEGGTSGTDEFFRPVIRPAIQDQTNNTPRRTGNDFVSNIAPWGDADGHSGFLPFGTAHVTTILWQEGTKVAAVDGQQLYARGLRPGAADYRLVQDAVRDPARYDLSPRVHSEWTFGMAQTDSTTLLPLITPTIRLDTDMAGNARWGLQTLTLTGSHQAGSTGGGAIGSASVEVSYDNGATWSAQPTERVGDGWKVTVKNPVSAKDSHVALRMALADDRGNAVTQTVYRAYALR